MARHRYTVRRAAWREWERTYASVPHLLTDIVDAIEALPPDQVEVLREWRPPAVIHVVTGKVLGRRFRVRGIRDAEDRWVEVWSVMPLPSDR